jgi:hypothetical protein
MAEWISLSEAIAGNVHDAAGHEIIRQHKRNLSLVRMTPGQPRS